MLLVLLRGNIPIDVFEHDCMPQLAEAIEIRGLTAAPLEIQNYELRHATPLEEQIYAECGGLNFYASNKIEQEDFYAAATALSDSISDYIYAVVEEKQGKPQRYNKLKAFADFTSATDTVAQAILDKKYTNLELKIIPRQEGRPAEPVIMDMPDPIAPPEFNPVLNATRICWDDGTETECTFSDTKAFVQMSTFAVALCKKIMGPDYFNSIFSGIGCTSDTDN